jgi:hypothetical protein
LIFQGEHHGFIQYLALVDCVGGDCVKEGMQSASEPTKQVQQDGQTVEGEVKETNSHTKA